MLKRIFDYINLQPTKNLILLAEIGKGSFGEVYLCFDVETNQLMALKLEVILYIKF